MPSWAWRACFYDGNNCSARGVCQPDGTCICDDHFSAIDDECISTPQIKALPLHLALVTIKPLPATDDIYLVNLDERKQEWTTIAIRRKAYFF
jgi:hypothetical protein